MMANAQTNYQAGQRVSVFAAYSWHQGTVRYQVSAEHFADGTGYPALTEDDIGKWYVILDHGVSVNGRHIYAGAFADEDVRELSRERDDKFIKLVRQIERATAEHGDQFTREAFEHVMNLQAECRAGRHEWGKPYGGYGGANERMDCQRPGCSAFVLD
jgi:hypothetical protein